MVLAGLQLQFRAALHRAGYTALATVFLLIGLFFVTLAVWLALALLVGALYASLTMALLFMGVGLVLLALGRRRYVRVPVAPPPLAAGAPRGPLGYAMPALLEAFVVGLTAGLASRRPPPPDKDD